MLIREVPLVCTVSDPKEGQGPGRGRTFGLLHFDVGFVEEVEAVVMRGGDDGEK